MSQIVFHYEFDPEDTKSNLDFWSVPPGAQIEASADDEEGIWISANQAGWEYIAKFAAQMALRKDLEKGMWHHHLDYNVRVLGVENAELTFGLETWMRNSESEEKSKKDQN